MNFNNWQTQLRKGLLEFITLSTLEHGPQHGYDMVQTLKKIQGFTIREGNIYPILARLQTDGLVKSKKQTSDQGPPRKYFELTRNGQVALEKMEQHWGKIVKGLQTIKEGKHL